MTGLPLTQDWLLKMGLETWNSLDGRAAVDSSPMNFGEIMILHAYETPEAENRPRFYSVRFLTKDNKTFTFHKEYTGYLRLVPEID